MKRIIFTAVLIAFGYTGSAQKISISFNAQLQDGSYIKLDSVRINNLTQSWSELLHYPDTILEMESSGITDLKNKEIDFSGVIPNPFQGRTEVSLNLPDNEHITLTLYDINAREYVSRSLYLERGEHCFRITAATPQMYLLHVVTTHGSKTLKLQNQGNGTGFSIEHHPVSAIKAEKATTANPLMPNDEMLYIGYRTKDNSVDTVQIRVRQAVVNSSYTFTFRMGWRTGDIYYVDGKAEGLVCWLADTVITVEGIPYGEHGKLISLVEPTVPPNQNGIMWGPDLRDVRVPAYDTLDGIGNTAIIKHYRDTSTNSLVWRFQAVTFVDTLGDGQWYLPAISELKALFAVIPVLNPVLTNMPGSATFTTTSNTSYWSSTADENENRTAYMAKWFMYPDNYITAPFVQNTGGYVRAMKLF